MEELKRIKARMSRGCEAVVLVEYSFRWAGPEWKETWWRSKGEGTQK